ncbi:MAG: protein translocase subunit SecF [Altererythrobacter sp.]|nr:protein translocase subunit SecF [Altererythrobacter sp.]OJU59139.1 MAG: protein-export membrane protein SecF [Altererythrobacter sp. 66-12]
MKLFKLIPDNTNIKFLRWRVPFYAVSLLLMAASFALVFTKGLNLGVDFVGGQSIRVTFAEGTVAPLAEVREEIDGLGYGDPILQQLGQPNQIAVRMKLPDEENPALTEKMNTDIRSTLERNHPDAQIGQAESVSGKVSQELFRNGMVALLLAMIGISIYIWIRFEWQFGVGALFALAHDVTLTVGLFSLTGMEFDLNIVASLLTLIGYSLNDNIVVYDRVRENLKKYRKMPVPELLDLSVNETLSRTVVTSTSLLITLVALLLLGPEVIFGFTLAITFGIFVGTYSSIYMATPILVWLGVKQDSFVPTESVADRQDRKARGEA